jgi:hypothetical protein
VIFEIVDILTNPDTASQLLMAGLAIITTLAESLLSPDAIDNMLNAAVEVVNRLVKFISQNLAPIINAAVKIITALVEHLLSPTGIANIISAAVEIVVALAGGLVGAVGVLLEAGGELLSDLMNKFSEADWKEIGKNIVDGIKKGISEAWDNLVQWFKGLFGDLIGIAKKILGIASPSKVFKKLGAWTAEGFGIGFDDEFANVARNIEDSLDFGGYDYEVVYDGNSFDSPSANGVRGGGVTVIQNIYSEAKTAADLMQEALYQQERAVYLGV